MPLPGTFTKGDEWSNIRSTLTQSQRGGLFITYLFIDTAFSLCIADTRRVGWTTTKSYSSSKFKLTRFLRRAKRRISSGVHTRFCGFSVANHRRRESATYMASVWKPGEVFSRIASAWRMKERARRDGRRRRRQKSSPEVVFWTCIRTLSTSSWYPSDTPETALYGTLVYKKRNSAVKRAYLAFGYA